MLVEAASMAAGRASAAGTAPPVATTAPQPMTATAVALTASRQDRPMRARAGPRRPGARSGQFRYLIDVPGRAARSLKLSPGWYRTDHISPGCR
jgi:hypothetical protein